MQVIVESLGDPIWQIGVGIIREGIPKRADWTPILTWMDQDGAL